MRSHCCAEPDTRRTWVERTLSTLAVTWLLICGSPARAAAGGVDVALHADSTVVTPGTTFDITVQVTASGAAFNGFDMIVDFDPAALTPVSVSPVSLQEGALMTDACGSRFHRFRPGSDCDT